MGKTLSLRKIDSLGRIVIPRDMRKALKISEWDELRLSLTGNRIIIERDKAECAFCGADAGLLEVNGKFVCKKCQEEIAGI